MDNELDFDFIETDVIENEMITISFDDITKADQLSLACPICAGAVHKYAQQAEMTPVVCIECSTLYHRLCWRQNGGKCAVLGCNCVRARAHGEESTQQGQGMVLTSSDIANTRPQQRNPFKQRPTRTLVTPATSAPEERQRSVIGRFFGGFLRALGFRQ